MKESQSKKKTSIVTKAIISLGVVLAATFFTFFLIGKWNAIPAKGVAYESMDQVNTQQQERNKGTLPEKQKRPDGKPLGKVVYLTFDDGPSELTGKFLDVLKEQNVASTFFMQGSNLQNTGFQENVKKSGKRRTLYWCS